MPGTRMKDLRAAVMNNERMRTVMNPERLRAAMNEDKIRVALATARMTAAAFVLTMVYRWANSLALPTNSVFVELFLAAKCC